MDCTLRSGDYVVQLFSCNTFLHDVTLAKFGLPYDENQGSNPPSYTYYNNYGHIFIYIYIQSRGLAWIAQYFWSFLIPTLFFTCKS